MADRTSGSVEIAAPRAAVLAVIEDVAAYPEWARGLHDVEVESTDDVGRPDVAAFSVELGPVTDRYSVRYHWPEGTAGEWIVGWDLVSAKVIQEMTGHYSLVEVSPEVTRVGYELSVRAKFPGFSLMKRKAEKRIVDTALADLKSRVEESARS